MANNPTTKVDIRAEDHLTSEVKKITKALEDMNKVNLTKVAISFDAITMAAKAVGAAISKVSSSISQMVKEYSTVDRFNSRLIATWDNVGKATGLSAQGLLDYADSLEKVTYFEAESIQTAAQSLASIQTLNDKGFKRALELSLDLAEAMGTDVPNAASIMSRALIAPEEGLGRLKTIGVNFTEEEKNLITELMNSNKEFEAQEIILGKIEEKYGGIAKAVADTDVNTLTQISNTLGTIRENLGQAILMEISPALDYILQKLDSIASWGSGKIAEKSIGDIALQGGDLSSFTEKQLKDFADTIDPNQYTVSMGANDANYIMRNNVLKELTRRKRAEDRQERLAGKGATSVNNSTDFSFDTGEPNILDWSSVGKDIESFYKQSEENLKKLEEQKEKARQTALSIADSTMSVFDAINNLITSSLEQEAAALEKEMAAAKEAGTLTVEEERDKQSEINKLKKKAFESNKANSITNALISGAEAIVKFLADPGGTAGVVLSALAGTTAALQVGTIASQQYTPMATGGIVSSPTHALVGEAGPEAIIPLTKGRNPLEGNGVTINITVQGNADEEVIFSAIERAQRTGLLPAWRYAN